MDDEKAYLYSVEASGVVTMTIAPGADTTSLQVAAIENLLDIIRAAGGPEGFVKLYGDLGVSVEFTGDEVTL